MGMNIIAILVLLAVTYTWLTRGFFSAFLHLVCAVVAAGVAFAAWEPLAYLLLKSADPHGLIGGSAWGIALAAPFGITLILLRVGVDLLVPANAVLPSAPNYIGGGVCGVIAGVIASGMAVISTSHMRVGTEAFGYQPIIFASNGSIERSGSLWVPTDKIVAALYSHMSKGVFGTSTPLAIYYHDLSDFPHTLRMSFGEGSNRITARPEDFSVIARYTVGDGTGTQKLDDLLVDGPIRKLPAIPAQKVSDIDGNLYPQGSRIEAFAVKFNAGAREKTEGKVSVGPSQIRLVVGRRDPNDATNWFDLKSVYPIAAIGQAAGSMPALARFRYDARDVFLASVGGASESYFAFEFVVPPGLEPLCITVKGTRAMIVDDAKLSKPSITFKTAFERDAALSAGRLQSILGSLYVDPAIIAANPGASIANPSGLDDTGKIVVGDGRPRRPDQGNEDIGFRVSERLPGNYTLQKSTTGGLDIDDKNLIIDGEHVFEPAMANRAGLERTLRIENFAVTPDTTIVQLNVAGRYATSLLGQSARTAELVVPPMLRDTNGQIYEPIGFVYEDTTQVKIRYSPGNPIRALSQLPSLSSSRPDQKLILIFRVSKGVDIKSFTLGSKIIAEYNPPQQVR